MTLGASFPGTCSYGSGFLVDAVGRLLRPGGDGLSERLISSADFSTGTLVADIGCGGGESLLRLASRGCEVLGVDIAADALVAARQVTDGARVLCASGMALPLREDSVGGVIAECSLSLMPNRRAALAEWTRVLRPGAVLAISDVFARHPQGSDQDVSGVTGQDTLIREIYSVGLKVVSFEDFSDVLKVWVASFVFHYGSLDSLWDGACGLSAETARRTAPGYFLMVARKPAGGCDV